MKQMSDRTGSSDRVSIEIENPLLLRWRELSRKQRHLHGKAYRYFKAKYDFSVYSNVLLTLLVGCTNIVFGVQNIGDYGVAVTVSGCLSLVAGAISSLAGAMRWSERYNKHDELSTRYGELLREINTESFLTSTMDDGVFRDMSEFIRHVSSEITRLEDRAPQVPKSVENRSS